MFESTSIHRGQATIYLRMNGITPPEYTFYMSVYNINSYDIHDMATFSKYGPLVVPLIHKYGGEVLASDTSALAVEGTARTMNAIIRFPSLEAALACYNDPEYEKIK